MAGVETMAQFQAFCTQELHDAIKRGAALPIGRSFRYDTPGGLSIFGDETEAESLSCDIGDEAEHGGDYKFLEIDWSQQPPEITEYGSTNGHRWSNTLPLAHHDLLARDFAKYVTLVVL